MKKKLVVALGNATVAADSAAIDFIRTIRDDTGFDVIEGGTDLLRIAEQMRDRELIVLVDTADTDNEITVIEHGSHLLSDVQEHAHHLSAVQALDLIRFSEATVRDAKCVWVLLGARYARTAP